MFSALLNSHNKVFTILINAVTWSIGSNTNSTYNGSAQSVSVDSINPIGATYSTSTTSATNAGDVASTTITGIGIYKGSFTSPNITIGRSVITIASSGSTSFSYNSSSKTVGYTVSGVYAADTNYAVSGISSTNAGSYTATLTTTSSNYVLGATTTIPWTISKALLTLTTSNKSMTYGSPVPTQTFDYSLSGFLGGDTTAVITGAASHSTTATSSSNVGSYPIITNLGTLSATNYTFSTVNGTLTINAATLTASTTTGSATYNGVGQAVTVLSGINGTFNGLTSVSGTNAGSYTTTITGKENYTGSVIGTLTIGKATLTIRSNNATMTYGSSVPVFTHTPSGFVNSETAAVITGTVTHSTTGTSSSNAGTYVITPSVSGLTATNYTFTPVNGTLTISPATLTASTTTGSATYNGGSQSVTVISGINGTFNGLTSVSETNAGSYTTTITGKENYTGSIIGTLTIYPAPASSSPASGTTIYQVYDGSRKSATVISGLSGLSYSASPIASGVNAGTYPTTITLGGNYSGNVTGYLVISQAVGDISLYFGGYVAAGDTNTKLFNSYLQRANATYTWSHSVSGPGAGDAYVQPGYGVQSLSYATSGFVVTITATISDPNYSASSATTSITFEAYVAPPPSGGGGYGGDGGFIAE
jgi:hypothetical protein